MQEAVIAQVVNIRNQNREGNTPPQFFDIGLCIGAVYADYVHDLGVSMFLGLRQRLNEIGKRHNVE
jgi:hypothetical protein